MNDGFISTRSVAYSDYFPFHGLNRGYIAEYRRQNVQTKLAHVHEQGEFTHNAYLVAAGQY